jgi:hypothetical protein
MLLPGMLLPQGSDIFTHPTQRGSKPRQGLDMTAAEQVAEVAMGVASTLRLLAYAKLKCVQGVCCLTGAAAAAGSSTSG